MLIDLHTSVLRFLKQAAKRIDGLAMYCAVCIFAAGAAFFAVEQAGMNDSHRLKLLWGSLLMIPLTLFLYVRLAMLSSATPLSRGINAVLLIALPVCVYWVAV